MKKDILSVLLLGGTGLLSSAVFDLCVKSGYKIFVLNRGNNNTKIKEMAKILIADFFDGESVKEVVGSLSFDVVVDFLSRKPNDIRRIYPIFKDKCKQYIFISTACVYRRFREDGIIKEENPKPNILWDYSVEKYECELLLEQMAKNDKKIYTIIRPYITYNNNRIPFGLVPDYNYHGTLISRIKNNKPLFIWGEGKNICTLTHSEDFARAAIGLFNNSYAFNEGFHITTPECCTWYEMLTLFFRLLDTESNIINIPADYIVYKLPEYRGMLFGDRILDAKFDNSKLLEAIPNFKFNISLEEGLKRNISFYKSQDDFYDIDYIYDAKIDKLIASYVKDKSITRNCRFINYHNRHNLKNIVIYSIYRYFPSKIIRWLTMRLKKIRVLIRL
jgi:nucleoside-diphosphate-sugar epimerase